MIDVTFSKGTPFTDSTIFASGMKAILDAVPSCNTFERVPSFPKTNGPIVHERGNLRFPGTPAISETIPEDRIFRSALNLVL